MTGGGVSNVRVYNGLQPCPAQQGTAPCRKGAVSCHIVILRDARLAALQVPARAVLRKPLRAGKGMA